MTHTDQGPEMARWTTAEYARGAWEAFVNPDPSRIPKGALPVHIVILTHASGIADIWLGGKREPAQ